MRKPHWITAITISAAVAGASIWTASNSRAEEAIVEMSVHAQTPEEAGRYLIRVSGCNDCHTPGFMQMGEKIPESLWLTGLPVGWRGPWGTTYASNLRLFIKPFSEDDFLKVCRTRNDRPPMPWPSLHAMGDQDLRAIYRYIKSLSPAGEAMPAFVPPEKEPKTPWLSMQPQMPQQSPVKQSAVTQPANASAQVR